MDKIIRISFSIGVFCILVGTVFNIQHWPGAYVFVSIGWIVYSVFILCSLFEYRTISWRSHFRKNMIVGLLGFLYSTYLIASIATYITDILGVFPWVESYIVFLTPVFLFGGVWYMLSVRRKLLYQKRLKIEFDFDKDTEKP
ncbi:MAG: hypothetical protein EOP56_16005 [Sphingobacteriales bacterium]|nr:MAG: hypothetical protein EOP56_16005 [Sphingobacteriales bacterium]